MTIRVRYFAGLREQMGRAEEQLAFEDLACVADVWKAVCQGRPLPENVLCAVNMEYAGADTPVRDGDEVAFFPPVTGG
ncbi:molybdopterin converting factor subunit 1 [Methylococcus sp. ANG]|uniref:molybdopterin converting factor subunit 1 n=1 Tax=unclassified Methylococcus TaxID=2618889 RepID=UPI001C533F41|nr:molybdopterin converting factor subunit 1 [Methylococcus sp. Mc7]QXP85407.1 molybdopterin converting factor subunit 1 [Methylococcus sp. Mc7]